MLPRSRRRRHRVSARGHGSRAPVPARVRLVRRRSGAGAGAATRAGYGYAYSTAAGGNLVAYTPEADVVTTAEPALYAAPVATPRASVAVFDGDDATFTLQGLRLARVNNDLAANLGRWK